jgi:catechol 2,3-dioxygenase-like lactoylglutathione lyase family enzyme
MLLDAIGIVTENVARSLQFYELLGVKLTGSGKSDHFEARLEGGLRLMLDSVELIKTFEPDFHKVTGTGPVLCFKQSSPKHVDEVYQRVIAAGFKGKKAPWDAFWGQRYACVLDPDGNQIDLFATL